METEEAAKKVEELEAVIAQAAKDNEGMRLKMEELLVETKAAKEAEAAEKAELLKAQEERQQASGDFEALLKSSEEKRLSIDEQLKSVVAREARTQRKNGALNIASKLADGFNVGILADIIEKRLSYKEDGELKVLDASGDLTVSTLDDLEKEFSADERFKSLLKGIQASGGGAIGGSGSAVNKELPRADFERLNPFEKSTFAAKGGTITD